MALTSGVNDAFTISAGAIVASANGALDGSGLTATVASGETLNVHTGVYADENGNWTDDRRIASALGFS
ncbi:MAG: hypothetical protein LBU12_08630, partial [Deltaproteobacteria bacterium]|nr:hypothetical protein [Deltaproteobacteria bacterium]